MSLIVASILVLMFLNLVLGSVSIPLKSVWNIICGLGDEPVTWQNIVWKSRLPQALTALVAGAGLAISGLQMQTVFRNPLAGPSVLGISSGASMGVAFVVLLSGSLGGVALSKLGFMGEIALSIAAVIGSLSVMALIVYVGSRKTLEVDEVREHLAYNECQEKENSEQIFSERTIASRMPIPYSLLRLIQPESGLRGISQLPAKKTIFCFSAHRCRLH